MMARRVVVTRPPCSRTSASTLRSRSLVGTTMPSAALLPRAVSGVPRRTPQHCEGRGESRRPRRPKRVRALDAHLELHDTLQRLEIAEADSFEFGLEVGAVAVAFELRFVDRHERLERADQLAGLRDRLSLHRRAHHRRGRLADRTTLPRD